MQAILWPADTKRSLMLLVHRCTSKNFPGLMHFYCVILYVSFHVGAIAFSFIG